MASSFYTRYIPPEQSAATPGEYQTSTLQPRSGDTESVQTAPHREVPTAKPKKRKRGVENENEVLAAVDTAARAQDADRTGIEANAGEGKRKKRVAVEKGVKEARRGREETRSIVNPEKDQESTRHEIAKEQQHRPGKVDKAPNSSIGRRGDTESKAEISGIARKLRNELKAKKGTGEMKGVVGHSNASNGRKDDDPGMTQNPADTKPAERQTRKNVGDKMGKRGKRRALEEDISSEDDESDGEMEEEKKYKSILSKFQRSTQISGNLAKESQNKTNHDLQSQEPFELKGLVPLPQPEEARDSTDKLAFSALPPWLARPITVSPSSTIPFKDLPINAKLISSLKLKGYKDAFAIQSAVLPMLLPGPTQHAGDLCISAATGSGKTLAYVLPMVESLRTRAFTRLRGLVVVPTRELVAQVKEVYELCSTGSGLSIGIAVGSRSLKVERDLLIKRGQKYDPKAYREMQEIAACTEDEMDNGFYDEFDVEDDHVTLPEHVTVYTSKVDILVCTPGRLVDHIRSTPGFTLEDLQWLVIDEADRLLDQSFQEWVDVVLKALTNIKEYGEMKAHEQILMDMGLRPPKCNTRKIVLSATMTRDIGKLAVLKLRKPKLVVVDTHGGTMSKQGVEGSWEGGDQEEAEQIDAFRLPPTLREWAVAAGDGDEKPLYLLQLLQTKILKCIDREDASRNAVTKGPSSLHGESKMAIDAGPISGIEGESVSSNHSSPTGTSTDNSSSTEDSESSSASSSNQAKSPCNANGSKASRGGGVLIFTKSNESAIRLSRLLSLLHPPLAPRIGTITGSIPSATRRKILAAFRTNKLPIILASDLVARGLDVENVAHIVNYDLPKSIRGYVHRVGRTARAGRKGEAWTLVTQKGARWFWNEIGSGTSVIRNGEQKVARVRLDIDALGLEGKKRYEEALGTLKSEVRGGPSSA